MNKTQIEEIEKLLKEIKADACPDTRSRNNHPFTRLLAIKEKAGALLTMIQYLK